VTENTASDVGGGLGVGDGTIDLTDSTVADNAAGNNGGGLLMAADGVVTATATDIVVNGPNDCGFEDNGEIVQGGGSVDSDGTCFPVPDPPPGPRPTPDPGNSTGGSGAGNGTGGNAATPGSGATPTPAPATLPATGTTTVRALLGAALLLAGGLALLSSRHRFPIR